MARKRTPWQRIRDAYNNGTGVRLSPEDVEQLGMDVAITTRAENDDLTPEEREEDDAIERRLRYPTMHDRRTR